MGLVGKPARGDARPPRFMPLVLRGETGGGSSGCMVCCMTSCIMETARMRRSCLHLTHGRGGNGYGVGLMLV